MVYHNYLTYDRTYIIIVKTIKSKTNKKIINKPLVIVFKENIEKVNKNIILN